MTGLPSLQDIARALGGEVRGNCVLAPGEGHSPKDRSLQFSLSPTAPDGFVVHSFAGDDDLQCKDYVREKLGLPKWIPNGRGNGAERAQQGRVLVAVHDYVNQSGELLYQKLRYAPKEPDGFALRRPDGKGGWLWGRGGIDPVLYRWPQVLEAVALGQPIVFTEGEKAADEAVAKLNVVATSCGGATAWLDRFADDLKGANVVILPDNDAPGFALEKQIKKSLARVGAHTTVVRLPGLPSGGDIYNWIAAGGTAEQLWALVEVERAQEGEATKSRTVNTLIVPSASFVANCGRGRAFERCHFHCRELLLLRDIGREQQQHGGLAAAGRRRQRIESSSACRRS